MSMDHDQKIKALDAALMQIEKQYGKGAVMKLGDPASRMEVETIPTGSLSLDIALGLGGIPRGRIVEIYGPESSGKTTVTLHMIAEVQRQGGIAGFIDAEHALDPVYAKNIGVDIAAEINQKVKSVGFHAGTSVRTVLVYDGKLASAVRTEHMLDFVIPAERFFE